MGLSPSQEGAPWLLSKAQPLGSLGTEGHLVETPHRETPKDRELNQDNGQREIKRHL